MGVLGWGVHFFALCGGAEGEAGAGGHGRFSGFEIGRVGVLRLGIGWRAG